MQVLACWLGRLEVGRRCSGEVRRRGRESVRM